MKNFKIITSSPMGKWAWNMIQALNEYNTREKPFHHWTNLNSVVRVTHQKYSKTISRNIQEL